MIQKKNRITSFFFKFLIQGRLYHSPLFSVKVIQNKEDKEFHVSVVVSKKVAHKAVERNLLKRRFLSVVKNNETYMKSGLYYIFYIKKEAKGVDFFRIEKEVSQTIRTIYEKNS